MRAKNLTRLKMHFTKLWQISQECLQRTAKAQASFLNVFATVLLTRIRRLLLQKVLFALLFSKPQCSARMLTGDVCFAQSDMPTQNLTLTRLTLI